MKTLEQLLLCLLRLQAWTGLQFAYQEKVGVEDAILYMLPRAYSHLEKGGSGLRITCFDLLSAFNTFQPLPAPSETADVN